MFFECFSAEISAEMRKFTQNGGADAPRTRQNGSLGALGFLEAFAGLQVMLRVFIQWIQGGLDASDSDFAGNNRR